MLPCAQTEFSLADLVGSARTPSVRVEATVDVTERQQIRLVFAPWTWRVGFTGFVRDARVALKPGDRTAEDTDVGFVPLGHVSAEARPRLKMFGGYRTIEGGADVDAVYASPGSTLS